MSGSLSLGRSLGGWECGSAVPVTKVGSMAGAENEFGLRPVEY